MMLQNALENLPDFIQLFKVVRLYRAYKKEKSEILLIKDTQQRIDALNKLEATQTTKFSKNLISYMFFQAAKHYDSFIDLFL